jgi:hypothetical protein
MSILGRIFGRGKKHEDKFPPPKQEDKTIASWRYLLLSGRAVTRHEVRCMEIMGGRPVAFLGRRGDRVEWAKGKQS